jgi:peroxiredoxin
VISLDQPQPKDIPMPLATGTKAPDFSLPTKTADGPIQIKLSDNFGKTNTLLLFFPMAFTGTCTTEMCGISQELPNYSGQNTTVYGISGDNPFAQEAWAKKENITVLLLSDYEHKIAKQYDVMYDSFLPQMNLGMGGVPKRSAFIIDRQGIIQYAESNDDARELPNFDKIKAKLKELQ